MKTGTATLPLHGGKCPAWLFAHMKALSAAVIEVIIEDYGCQELLNRLSNPHWFQALGCLAGFDWHSSGLTTTLCGAIKEGCASASTQTGIFFAGGKGKTARNTPLEIESMFLKHPMNCSAEELIYASKISAKVDSAAVQDNYQIYHHFFIFTRNGEWAVIQQGMNENNRLARRYHWLGKEVNSFCNDPQAAICCDAAAPTLNMVSADNNDIRALSCEMTKVPPDKLIKEIKSITNSLPELNLPFYHAIPSSNYLNKALYASYEANPGDFEQLLQVKGVGAGTLRALCLVAEVAYGAKPSFEDPVRYSFAHGGKDGFPFPVNEHDILCSYTALKRALNRSKIGRRESLDALKRLSLWHSQLDTPTATPRLKSHIYPHQEAAPASNPSSLLFQPGLFQQ